MSNSNLIYHYTSFEKLQCILQHGTLRFRESTKSNDLLDTMGFVNILKNMPKFKAPIDTNELLNFILGYYQRDTYCPSAVFLVSCFSRTPDSRLLWDAYTMHRPGNQKCTHGEEKYCYETPAKYNGVCIAFRQDKLKELLEAEEGVSCDKTHIQAIDYDENKLKALINKWLKEAAYKSYELSKDPDQSQSIIPSLQITRKTVLDFKKSLVVPSLEFLQNVEAYSPFYKHEFWREENEVRASLLVTNGHLEKYKIQQSADRAKFRDISIVPDCIDHIILGPEFDDVSFSKIKQHTDYKLDLLSFKLKKSIGTGVIRNC